MFATAKSELARHTEPGSTRDDEDDSWIFAGENESVDSFLTNCPPSFMEKSWISASHDGRAKLVEEYYTATMGAEGTRGRDSMDDIKAAWEASEVKTAETLTAILKEHKFGSGKWMIFVSASDVDSTWRKIVSALWDGKLGHSAKVSGNTPESNGSHVINVFVDPFWEVVEVERVLAGLRELCGVSDAIKFKADGVSQLGLGKGNVHGIPPSFYAANRGSSSLSVQKPSTRSENSTWKGNSDAADGKTMESARSMDSRPANAEQPKWGANRERGGNRDNTWVRRDAPRATPRSAPVAAPQKPKAAPQQSAFAALMGVEDDDADAIIAAKARKKDKARKKKEEAEVAAAEKSERSFEALKAGLKADWGDSEDEEELAPTPAAEEGGDSSSGEESEESEESEEESAPHAPAPVVDISEAPAREKTADELEVEALLASIEIKEEDSKGAAEEGSVSKSAAKRAKKKAAAAETDASAPNELATPSSTTKSGDDSTENASEAPEDAAPTKSAADIKKLLAAKSAKMKKSGKDTSSSAAAAAEAEAKARQLLDGGKKKKGPRTWEAGGKHVGQKARGSDNKYQGE